MAKEGKSGKPISGSSTGRRNFDLIRGGHTALIRGDWAVNPKLQKI